jgi:hypothetical protein
MDKNSKLSALEVLATMGGGAPAAAPALPAEPHEATCPNCGHTWVMGEENVDPA